MTQTQEEVPYWMSRTALLFEEQGIKNLMQKMCW
jgi:hypothetical protein